MENNLRVCKSYSEIFNLLYKIKKGSSKVLMWQNDGNKRVINRCKIEYLDKGLKTFSLRPVDTEERFEFQSGFTIYFKGREESILFKGTLSYTSDNLLVIEVPDEIRLLEKRSNPRTEFEPFEGTQFMLAKYTGRNNRPTKFSLNLLDFNDRGISFNIVSRHFSKFKTGDQFFLVEMGGAKLDTPFEAEIVYVIQNRVRVDGRVFRVCRVGAKFSKQVSKRELTLFNTMKKHSAAS